MKIYIINGPNINMLGIREPELYGKTTYSQLCERISKAASEKDIQVEIYQSNHEGDIVDKIQDAYFLGCDGIIINPAAYTHTSIAILDAIKAVRLPTIEVHISDIDSRESFRSTSFIRPYCISSVIGKGVEGYIIAMEEMKKFLLNREGK